MNKIWMFEALDYHKRLIPLLTLPLLLLLIVGVILLGELKSALSSGQVSMHDQPKIHIPSSEVHSVEALMRWNHPTRGNVPPGAFIPRAEQSTLLKIDQCFVRRLPGDAGAAHILEAAITLAHKMGIQAIAEGVETLEVYDFLSGLGCDLAQGYLMSKPLPADEYTRWYRQCNGRYACWGGL